MAIQRFVLFLIALASVFKAGATPFVDQSMSYKDQMIYQETKQICDNSQSILKALGNKNTLDAFLISTGQSLSLVFGSSVDDVEKASKQNMLSDYSADRLRSEGFIQAVRDCFPNNENMRSAFVLSMMGADTLGKIPSVLAMMSVFRASGATWTKMVTAYPKISVSLRWGSALSAVVYAVLETRSQLANRELSDYEKQRLENITSNMHKITAETRSLVVEMALEEIAFQELALAQSTSDQERAQIRDHIQRMKASLEKLSEPQHLHSKESEHR